MINPNIELENRIDRIEQAIGGLSMIIADLGYKLTESIAYQKSAIDKDEELKLAKAEAEMPASKSQNGYCVFTDKKSYPFYPTHGDRLYFKDVNGPLDVYEDAGLTAAKYNPIVAGINGFGDTFIRKQDSSNGVHMRLESSARVVLWEGKYRNGILLTGGSA